MIKKIAVLGGGTMGHGIAETFAIHGYDVNVYETSDKISTSFFEVIRNELNLLSEFEIITDNDIDIILNRICLSNNIYKTVKDADYVIEALPEDVNLKKKLFSEIDGYCKPETIFASNTSSLALDQMLVSVSDERKRRMMVCHWYNPAHLMPIAELSFFGNMGEDVYTEVESLYINSGKQVVKVLKDVPGLVANRIQQAVAREVFSLIEMGVADSENIDKALKFGPAFRYATTGQFEVADMGGLDIWCTVGDNLLKVMDNSTDANPLLRKKVSEGKLGMKSGEGFYKYSSEEMDTVKDKFNRRLIIQLKAIPNYI